MIAWLKVGGILAVLLVAGLSLAVISGGLTAAQAQADGLKAILALAVIVIAGAAIAGFAGPAQKGP